MYSEIINEKEYRLVSVRGREKLISKDGDAINPKRRKQKVTIHYNADGYPCFGGGIPVHLYVGYAWVNGHFEGAEINHKDFDRNNYNYTNLEWLSHLDNIKYSLKNNYEKICKSKTGEKNGRSVFTEEDVLKIREMSKNGISIMNIIKYFYPDMSFEERRRVWSRFAYAIKGKSWKNI